MRVLFVYMWKNRSSGAHDLIDLYGLMKPILACPVPRMTRRGKWKQYFQPRKKSKERWRGEDLRDNLSKKYPVVPPLYLSEEWTKMMKEQEEILEKSCSENDSTETDEEDELPLLRRKSTVTEIDVFDDDDSEEKVTRPDIVPPICHMIDVIDEEEER